MSRAYIPDNVKRARGTYRADREKQSSIISLPIVDRPDPPESLGEAGRSKWVQWVELLIDHKLLEKRYLDALEIYCDAWDRVVHYKAVIAQEGEFTTVESGYVCAHPATSLLKQAREEIRKYQTEFGFTPSSASRVNSGAKPSAVTGVPSRKRDLG